MILTDKVAIVTGAGGKGCGRAIACRLAREGASVVIADIREAGIHDTSRAIAEERMRASVFRVDVSNEAEVRTLFEFAESRTEVLILS